MAVLLSHEELIKLLAGQKKPVKMSNGGDPDDAQDTSNADVTGPNTINTYAPPAPAPIDTTPTGPMSTTTYVPPASTPAVTMDQTRAYNPDDPTLPHIKGAASYAAGNATVTPGTYKAPTSVLNPTTIGAYKDATASTVDRTSAANVPLTDLLTQLSNQAQGIGPSVAGTQLEQGRQANIAAIMAQANSARGGYNPMQARQAMQAGASLNAKANQEAAMQRLQEQEGAQKLLSQTGTTMRGQDFAAGTADAQMKTNVALANAKNDLDQKIAKGQITAAEAAQLRDAIEKAGQFNASQTQAADAATQTLRRGYLADLMNFITGARAAASQEDIAASQADTAKTGAEIGGGASVLATIASMAKSPAPAKAYKGGMAVGYAAGGTVDPNSTVAPPDQAQGDYAANFAAQADKSKGYSDALSGVGGAIGSVVGGAAGTYFGGPGGGVAGSTVGGMAGKEAGKDIAGALAPAPTYSPPPLKIPRAGSDIEAAIGGVVPGKALKPGDHPDNDIIPARLSPGEFVIPRSLTSDKELMSLVHKKMAEHEAAKQNTTKAAASFSDVIKAHQDLTKKVEDLKKMFAGGAVSASKQLDNTWIGNPGDKDSDDDKK